MSRARSNPLHIHSCIVRLRPSMLRIDFTAPIHQSHSFQVSRPSRCSHSPMEQDRSSVNRTLLADRRSPQSQGRVPT
eukprot:scaffold192_cov331-Pavlova_lutheri.AAC.11